MSQPDTSSRSRRPSASENITGLAMIAPAGTALLLFVAVPFVLAIWFSLHFINMNSILPPRWVGFQQYTQLALASIIVLSVWQGVGLQMIIILAGLQEISPDLYEAAIS
jgi:ABC-type sugar transport system permease subunit